LKKLITIKRAGGVAQGLSPEFKPQSAKKKKERKRNEDYKLLIERLFNSDLLTFYMNVNFNHVS
jgi:hypothetical protein